MQNLAIVAALSVSGCSWIFMETVPKGYDGTTEPRCTATAGYAAWDGAFVVVDLISLVLFASIDGDANGEIDTTPYVVASGLSVVFHGLAAVSGTSAAKQCREARERFDLAIRERIEADRLDSLQRLHGREPEAITPGDGPVAVRSRGYLCTASPTDTAVGACNKTREGCASSQRKLVAAGHDVGPCTEAEHAVCFTASRADGTEVSGCTPTVKGCMRQRENASANPDYPTVGECADR